MLGDMGYSKLEEFTLGNDRRANLFAIAKKGEIVIVEIKTSVADFRADAKWRDYLPHCDRLYFGVAQSFPLDLIPVDAGVIVTDGYDGAIVRDAVVRKMATRLRHQETRRFARHAANRLRSITDPAPGQR